MNEKMTYSHKFFLVFILAAFLLFFRLGDRSFRNPDEGRYAKIAQEMTLSGDWVTPRLYGVAYLKKPILFYWLVAASFKTFGTSEWAARAVPAFFGFLGILAAFFFAKIIFGSDTAFFSSLILASNLFYLQVSRYLVIDAVFSFFVVSALYSFYLGVYESKNKAKFYLLFFFLSGLAFLTKGVIAVVIPAISIFIYAAATRKIKRVFSEMPLGPGAAVFAAVTFPWFFIISKREPGFLSIFFLHEHLSRFVSRGFEHQEAWYFYWVFLLAVFLPWFLFPPAVKKGFYFLRDRASDDPKWFLFLSSLATILFFSLSRAKLMTYILPVVPLVSILLADGWAKLSSSSSRRIFFIAIGLLAVVAFVFPFLMEMWNSDYTTQPFARALSPRLKSGDTVFIYDNPGAMYDFGFYLGYPVKLVGMEGELELSKNDPKAGGISVSHKAFEKMMGGKDKIYCLMRKSDFLGLDPAVRQKLKIMKEDDRKTLVESIP